eukprot:g2337.t1
MFVSTHHEIGKRLLMQMGWRPMYGVGPRKRREGLGVDDPAFKHTFAPKDVHVFRVVPKNDTYGVGFSARHRLGATARAGRKCIRQLPTSIGSNIGAAHRGGFGLGAFEAPEEEDVYADDDMSIANILAEDSSDSTQVTGATGTAKDMKAAVAALVQNQKRAATLRVSKPSARNENNLEGTVDTEQNTVAHQLSSRFCVSGAEIGGQETKHGLYFPTSSSLPKKTTTSAGVSESRRGRQPRKTCPWAPARLLCKRFGLSVPVNHGAVAVRSDAFDVERERQRREVASRASYVSRSKLRNVGKDKSGGGGNTTGTVDTFPLTLDVEDLSKPKLSNRPAAALFRAIFGASSEDEEGESESCRHVDVQNTQRAALRKTASTDATKTTAVHDANETLSGVPSWAIQALKRARRQDPSINVPGGSGGDDSFSASSSDSDGTDSEEDERGARRKKKKKKKKKKRRKRDKKTKKERKRKKKKRGEGSSSTTRRRRD